MSHTGGQLTIKCHRGNSDLNTHYLFRLLYSRKVSGKGSSSANSGGALSDIYKKQPHRLYLACRWASLPRRALNYRLCVEIMARGAILQRAGPSVGMASSLRRVW